MVFVVDDLGAWLVGLLADVGRRKLITLVLGSDQERALRQAAEAAVGLTAAKLAPVGGEQAGQLAMVVGEVFRGPAPEVALAGQGTLLEALEAGIADKLAVLDDPEITGTGQSSAELLGMPGGVLAETLAGHLLREIMVRGSRGGPLTPLANQLNQDATHLQGQRLEGMLAQLADQVMALPRAGGSPEAPRKPVRLPPRPVFLAGREELLGELDAWMKGCDGSGPQTVALCGLGGAGKTSVAVEYAHRHLAEVGVAWQFAAEDPAVLAAGFSELAAQLGSRDLLDPPDPVASVHGVLAAFPAGWLLVFDNAPDRASVEAFLPPAGPGRVLITSRSSLWPRGQALEVPVFGTGVAADFLVNRTGDADRQAARELAVELGGLPLALEQAAAYMQATGRSIAEYLTIFRQRPADLIARGEPIGYDKQVATTWALAFDQLRQTAPRAIALLRLLGCCAPEQIPLRLLLRPHPGLPRSLAAELGPLLDDPLAADDAVAALRRFSLVSPPQDGSVSVHRLVQAVTIGQLPADQAEEWRQAAWSLIEAALPSDAGQPETWPVYAALLPHAQAAHTAGNDGLAQIAAYLGYSGNYVAARELSRGMLDEHVKVLGPEHPDTLAVRFQLAAWTANAGDPAVARDQLAELVPVMERVLGPEHPDTLGVRDNLAAWTGSAGDPAAARDQLAELVPVMERVLGPEHPDTLVTRDQLAIWIGAAGDPAAARDQLAELVPVMERVLGPKYPDTLRVRDNLAHWTGEAGDPAAARDLLAGLVPVMERVLGPEHPSILAARRELARWTGEVGDPAAARDLLAGLVPVMERVLGPEHPSILAARRELAGWTGEAGDAARARDQSAALLPVMERVLGPEHSDTLTARHELARWTGEAGDATGARDQSAALLPVREQVSGPEDPYTLGVRGSLARWTGEAGDAAGARDQFAALLPVMERISGPEHLDTLAARGNLAYWTRKTESAEEHSEN